jgi:hypothetical protein
MEVREIHKYPIIVTSDQGRGQEFSSNGESKEILLIANNYQEKTFGDQR